jgi:RNA polymerase sigma-70 factor, ECF subfamily
MGTGTINSGRLNVFSSDGCPERPRILGPDGSRIEFESRTSPLRRRRIPLEAKQEQVLQELLLTSRERFVRVAYGILQNQEDAEDAVQDGFLCACRYFGSFEGRSAVTTWLTRIVMNAALMIRRKRKKTLLRSFHDLDREETAFVETMPDFRPNPESACAQAESLGFLNALLNKMDPPLRKAVSMTYYDELSASEASSALTIPMSAYKARLLRGKRFLQSRARRRA